MDRSRGADLEAVALLLLALALLLAAATTAGVDSFSFSFSLVSPKPKRRHFFFGCDSKRVLRLDHGRGCSSIDSGTGDGAVRPDAELTGLVGA